MNKVELCCDFTGGKHEPDCEWLAAVSTPVSPQGQGVAELVRRLRAPAYWMSGSNDGHEGENEAPREAADALERYHAALEEIQWGVTTEADEELGCDVEVALSDDEMREIARTALTGEATE